jgi:hypothetical protein
LLRAVACDVLDNAAGSYSADCRRLGGCVREVYIPRAIDRETCHVSNLRGWPWIAIAQLATYSGPGKSGEIAGRVHFSDSEVYGIRENQIAGWAYGAIEGAAKPRGQCRHAIV